MTDSKIEETKYGVISPGFGGGGFGAEIRKASNKNPFSQDALIMDDTTDRQDPLERSPSIDNKISSNGGFTLLGQTKKKGGSTRVSIEIIK